MPGWMCFVLITVGLFAAADALWELQMTRLPPDIRIVCVLQEGFQPDDTIRIVVPPKNTTRIFCKFPPPCQPDYPGDNVTYGQQNRTLSLTFTLKHSGLFSCIYNEERGAIASEWVNLLESKDALWELQMTRLPPDIRIVCVLQEGFQPDDTIRIVVPPKNTTRIFCKFPPPCQPDYPGDNVTYGQQNRTLSLTFTLKHSGLFSCIYNEERGAIASEWVNLLESKDALWELQMTRLPPDFTQIRIDCVLQEGFQPDDTIKIVEPPKNTTRIYCNFPTPCPPYYRGDNVTYGQQNRTLSVTFTLKHSGLYSCIYNEGRGAIASEWVNLESKETTRSTPVTESSTADIQNAPQTHHETPGNGVTNTATGIWLTCLGLVIYHCAW